MLRVGIRLNRPSDDIGTCRIALALVARVMLGVTLVLSQLSSALALLPIEDVIRPVSESSSPEPEDECLETLCTSVGRFRPSPRRLDRESSRTRARLTARPSAQLPAFSRCLVTVDREFDHRNGTGAFLRC